MFREKLKPPTVATCRHRRDPRREGDAEVATCLLVKGATGVEDDAWCRVRRDACEECCRSFPPAPAKLNPVVASLVYEAATRVLAAGGAAGCDAGRAAALREASARALDLVAPAESTGAAASGPGEPLARLVPLPPRRRGRVASWAVGATTASRRRPTLERCLDSLTRAGWESPYLFIDAAVNVPERFAHLPGTFRDASLGAWPSYYLALAELLMREPQADAFLLVQDDALLYDGEDLRAYLEAALWPGRRPGLVSLYCSSAYTRPSPGWHRHEKPWVWGALAFAFPRELADAFVIDPRVFEHRRSRLNDGLANIDVVIGRWAMTRQVDLWHPTPSLAQHVGESSTLWPTDSATGPRRADWFAGEPRPRR